MVLCICLDLTALAPLDYGPFRSEIGAGGHAKPEPSHAEAFAGHEPIVHPVVPDYRCLDGHHAIWCPWLPDSAQRF